MNASLHEALIQAVGAQNILTEAADYQPYSVDWRARFSGKPACVVFPRSVDAAQSVVRLCSSMKVAMVPQGGNTGLCGGATPRGGEVVINLLRLDRIRWLDVDNRAMAVDAGCTLHQVQQAAMTAGLMFPLSLAAEGSATIGGNLSTNAGGVQVIRYGNARNLTLGVEVILPDGRVWDGMRALRKDNTGYDLRDMFIGAEGTLGLITGAVLKLLPRPKSVLTAWLALDHPRNAVQLLSRLGPVLGESISAFELIDHNSLTLVLKHIHGQRCPLNEPASWQVLIEVENCSEAAFAETLAGLPGCGISDALIARNSRESAQFWSLRENIPEAQKCEGHSVKHDLSLPVSRIPEFIDRAYPLLTKLHPELRIVCFGHLGDGNLHFNLSLPNPEDNCRFVKDGPSVSRLVYDLVHELSGSISAEHGLGQLKRDEILRYKTEVEMDLMRSIKRSIDPLNLMNPGKVV